MRSLFESIMAGGATARVDAERSSSWGAQTPKVEAGIRRGQLNVLGTAKSERIALRLKPGSGPAQAPIAFRQATFLRREDGGEHNEHDPRQHPRTK